MKYPYRDPETGRFACAIVRHLPTDCDYVQIDYECHDMQQITNTDYDQFFVIVGDGEFLAVWGMYGSVPYWTNPVYRIL